jgi:hypothetical protein
MLATVEKHRKLEEISSKEKLNCWEYRQCGREPGGRIYKILGGCPAATETRTDGVNGGVNGGRICWAIAGTKGTGNRSCSLTFSEKITDCVLCDFYQKVFREEDDFEIYPLDD